MDVARGERSPEAAGREGEREGGAAESGSQRERCSRTSKDGELLLELMIPCLI